MSIESLKSILPPPTNPSKTGNSEGWSEVEKVLGSSLPKDYKTFISTYGTGGIDNFIWILTPFVSDENVNFFGRSEIIRDAYLESKQQFPQYYTHNVFPENGGILPWGYTDNGDELYWLTNQEPETWTIIVYESRSSVYHEYPMSMTEFLFRIVSKNLVSDAFPEDFPSENPEFISVVVE